LIGTKAYPRQVASVTSIIVPVHYDRSAAKMTDDQLVDFIAAEQVLSPTKKRLLTSLDEPYTDGNPPGESKHRSTVIRKRYYGQILEKSLLVNEDLSSEDAAHIMEVFQWLSEKQVSELFEYLRKIA